MQIVTYIFRMVNKANQSASGPDESASGQVGQKASCPLLDNLNQSFLPKSDGYPRSFDSVNLNMLIKLIYFEQQSNYQKITLKDLENFKEEDLHQTQPNGGDFDFGSMLQMMGMGGGNEQQSNGDLGLASLLSGGGSGDIDQLLKAFTNPNTQ